MTIVPLLTIIPLEMLTKRTQNLEDFPVNIFEGFNILLVSDTLLNMNDLESIKTVKTSIQ